MDNQNLSGVDESAIVRKLAFNEQGEMVDVPVMPATEKGSRRLRKSKSKDGQTFSSSIRVKDCPTEFFIIEMTDEDKEWLKKRNSEDFANKLGIDPKVAKDVSAFRAAIKDVPNGNMQWMEWQAETNEMLCLKHIKRWSDPEEELTEEVIRDFFPSVQFELAGQIITKSTLGAANADFLGLS